MKTFFRTAAIAVVALLSSVAVFAEDAAPTTPAADPFTMTLPDGYAAFTKQVQNTKSPDGDIETTNWISKAPSGEAVIVTVSKMPGKILDPEKLISSTRESLLKSLGATSESEETFRSNAAVFRVHYTVIDDKVYQVLYVGRSDEQRNAPAVGQIFQSFHINS